MKTLLFVSLLLCSLFPAFAKSNEQHEQALIHSIDDYELPKNYIEVSEEGLPPDHYFQLLQQMMMFKFTLLNGTQVNESFTELKRNSRARMKYPGGQCSYRRAYIQNHFKKLNVVTGNILIHCPVNNGRLKLQDQVSGRYYTFSNFHDANIVAVSTDAGNQFQVLDLQFKDTPVTLEAYLAEIESSQRIRPSKTSTGSRGICYWSISTPYLKY